MKVIFLKGNYQEIAEFYLKNSLKAKTNLKYFMKLRKKFFTRNSRNILKKFLIKFIAGYYYSKFEKNLEEDYREFIKNFAKFSNVKYKNFSKLILFADVLTYLFSKFPQVKLPHFNFGCSSIVKINDYRIEHGRNLDFFGGNIWSSSHEIVVVFPEKGYKYISIGAEGFFSPGITSINESLISISLHMLYSEEVNEKGLPILNLMYKILLNSSSLNDIRKILHKYKTITGWGIVATDHKNKEASIFELTGKEFKELKINNSTGYVNNYLTELSKTEYFFSFAWIKNNKDRLNSINNLLNKDEKIENILSSREDENLGGFTVANNFTISSAIFNVISDELLVADNTVPASIGKYKKYVLTDLFNGKISEKPDSYTKKQIDKNIIEKLVVAYDKLLVDGKYKKFINSLKEIDKYPVPLFIAIMYAKSGNIRKGIEYLEKIDFEPLDNYRKYSIELLLGIFHDINREREKAKLIYRKLIQFSPYPDINFYCLIFLKKGAKRNFLERIDINMFLSHYVML